MKRALYLTLAALTLAVVVTPSLAQPRPPRPPDSAFQFRLGWFSLKGDSDFWDETEDVFTLDTSDFEEFTFGFTYVHSVSNHVEIGFNMDFFEEDVRSAYRDWLDIDGKQILHDTRLEIIPWTVDVRYIPGGRYRVRPGGRHVIKPVFYVGVGAGMTLWEYEEVGDFLDFVADPVNPPIFFDRFVDDGVAFEAHVLAGVELPMGRMTQLIFEGRYSDSDDKLGGDFSELDNRKIDLGGGSLYGGLSFKF